MHEEGEKAVERERAGSCVCVCMCVCVCERERERERVVGNRESMRAGKANGVFCWNVHDVD